MTGSCIYCIQEAYRLISCTSSCLTNSNIPPVYPWSILFSSTFLSFVLFLLTFHFKDNLKKFIGFRLVSMAFLSTAIFTLGLIFNGHFILQNLPFIIPLFGIGSYMLSYFFSYYLVKFSYKPMVFESKSLHKFISRISKKLKIQVPSIYIFFSGEPKAFVVDGFKKAIFISDSLIEKLDANSVKTVLLHELYHLKRGSGMIKNLINSISNLNFNLIPVPINELEKYEEEEIDRILLEKHGRDIKRVKSKLWN